MKLKKLYTRIALPLSVVILLVLGIMGTGTTLAWFADTDEGVKNIFHLAELDLVVEYLDQDGVYKELESATEVFDDEARYEPGYTQVAYLRVTNNGTVPFDFKTAVGVEKYDVAVNVYGWEFLIQDYLRFGVVSAESPEALKEKIATRELADACANSTLSSYAPQTASLAPNGQAYLAVIVRMPKEVGNEANYRGQTVPSVALSLIVKATQQNITE